MPAVKSILDELAALFTFQGAPKTVAVGGERLKDFGDGLWESLNADNKVSLFVRYIDRKSGETETLIYNKHV